MSLLPPILRRVLAVVLAVACCATVSVRAAPAALPANVLRLLHDLQSISPGATVTDEEKQVVAADLTALATSLVKPSAASVDQLADDLAAAAASGKLTRKVERLLARDLAAVLDRTALDPAALRALVDEVRTILAAYGLDAADLQQLAADLETIIGDFQTTTTSTRRVLTLQSEGIPPLLLMNYSGRAKLVTVQAEGQPARVILSIDTFGLPPVNPFVVAVTRHSDGVRLVLGRLRVRSGWREIIRPKTAVAESIPHPQAEIDSHGEAVFGAPGGRPLPEGFDPADLDTLTVTDDNGTERLTGSFLDAADLQSSVRLVNWRVDPGAADAVASGAVSFLVRTVGTRTRDAFLLYVGGLPASAEVALLADGMAVGTFTTTPGGQLVIAEGAVPVPTSVLGRMLPVNPLPASVDLTTLSSLILTDTAGNPLATAGM